MEHGGLHETASSASLNEVMPALYSELRRLARSYLRAERSDHTLQPTALVHEAYLRLSQQENVDWKNEAHVLGVAAQLMRRVLASHAERHNAQKRAGSQTRIEIDMAHVLSASAAISFIELDRALSKLQSLDERQGRVAEMRLFGGLTSKQISEVLSISVSTAERDWSSARLWLARALTRKPSA